MKLKFIGVAMVLLVIAVIAVLRLSRPSASVVENSSLSEPTQQLTQISAPAPERTQFNVVMEPDAIGSFSNEPAADLSASTNLFDRYARGDVSKLTAELVEPFLRQHDRNAESLLAAFQATGDRAYLLEAMGKFPNDPRVGLLAYYRGASAGGSGVAASEERRNWLEAFRQADTNNALADYLFARDHFETGRPDLALKDILAAEARPAVQDYGRDSMRSIEEAYRAAGYSDAEAKAFARGTSLTHLTELRVLGDDLVKLANSRQAAGDEAGAQSALQAALTLAERLNQPASETLVPTMTSLMIRRNVLNLLDPNAPYGSTGQTVRNELETVNRRYDELKTLVRQSRLVLPTLPAPELVKYFDMQQTSGEEAALRWVLGTQSSR